MSRKYPSLKIWKPLSLLLFASKIRTDSFKFFNQIIREGNHFFSIEKVSIHHLLSSGTLSTPPSYCNDFPKPGFRLNIDYQALLNTETATTPLPQT